MMSQRKLKSAWSENRICGNTIGTLEACVYAGFQRFSLFVVLFWF